MKANHQGRDSRSCLKTELTALLWNRDTQSIHSTLVFCTTKKSGAKTALQFTASYKLHLWIPHTHLTLQTLSRRTLSLKKSHHCSSGWHISQVTIFPFLYQPLSTSSTWFDTSFVSRYVNESPLVICPSQFYLPQLPALPIPFTQRDEKITTTTKMVQIWEYFLLFVLLGMSREVQSNRLTSEGTDGRWAAEEKLLLPQLTGQSSTAKLQGNGREATNVTCISKKATILLLQHDSTGRTSQDKRVCTPQKVHMPHCSCPNVTQKDKETPEKHLHIATLLATHTLRVC